jgi:hypothetical protein
MYLELHRTSQNAVQTLGQLFIMNENHLAYACFATLELPWRENKRQISCIPCGVYTVKKRWSLKYGHHLHILEVSGRSFILFHSGNFWWQIRGCILVGTGHRDINSDGHQDVINSRVAMKNLMQWMTADEVTLNIIDTFKIEVQ